MMNLYKSSLMSKQLGNILKQKTKTFPNFQCCGALKFLSNQASTQAKQSEPEATLKLKLDTCRTTESDPAKHGPLHHGLFYTIPSEAANRLFVLGGLDKQQTSLIKTFQEHAIMVRKPALEIISLLEKTDFSRPPNRYVLCKLKCETCLVEKLNKIIFRWRNRIGKDFYSQPSSSLWIQQTVCHNFCS